jgi:nucleoid-associated protein YgaU
MVLRIPEWTAAPSPLQPAAAASVAIASSTTAPEASASVASNRTYTIKSGDTLGKIAQAELGGSSKWKQIVDANPGLDPRKLKVGQVIKLP